MNVNIIGISSEMDFATEDGSRIQGRNIFVTYPETGVQGLYAERIFLQKTIPIPAGLKVGDSVELVLNRKGKVTAVSQSKNPQPANIKFNQ